MRTTLRPFPLIALLTSLFSAPFAHAQIINEDLKLLPGDLVGFSSAFGFSVGISDGIAIVGDFSDDENGTNSGSAYLFDVATGQQIAKLLADDGADLDDFGFSVAISGNTAIVGAPSDNDTAQGAGSAYLFDVTTGQQLFKLLPSTTVAFASFGQSVAISGDIAIVGAFLDRDDNLVLTGTAYLFDVTTGQLITRLLPTDGAPADSFGVSVAIDGNIAIIGAYQDDDDGQSSGSAYLFDVTTGQQIAKLVASDAEELDLFGFSVAISGNTAIVGALGDDDLATNSGAAYLFNITTGQQIAKLLPSDGAADDQFGASVAISGNTAIVGARNHEDNGSDSGSAYLFDVATGRQIAKLLPSDVGVADQFGRAVAISASTTIVGARFETDNDDFIGSAYLFTVPCPGDINADRTVDLEDLMILADNFGAGPDATPEQGDLNSDALVNLADFNILAVNFGIICNE